MWLRESIPIPICRKNNYLLNTDPNIHVGVCVLVRVSSHVSKNLTSDKIAE